MNTTTQKIQGYLKDLEKDYNIRILLACETGSRAWGFPSPDSDYDVRVIYVHEQDWYLSVQDQKDSIERMLDDNEIDISAWEWKKSLRLLQKSNAALLERLQSPIIYQAAPDFINKTMELAATYYARKSSLYHYLGLCKKSASSLSNKQPYKLKKFFYALRAAAVCRWIMEEDSIPPMEFGKVYTQIGLPNTMLQRIKELIALKATVGEAYLHEGESDLLAFIQESIALAEAAVNELPTGTADLDALNTLFRSYI